jgi:hypothetical protein
VPQNPRDDEAPDFIGFGDIPRLGTLLANACRQEDSRRKIRDGSL